MMLSVLVQTLLLFSASVSAATPFTRGLANNHNVIFGMRGGGLFGGKDEKKDTTTDAAAAAAAATPGQKFPAMTQTEVEEWLEHIPVFAVTDSQGQGVVLRPDNDTSVFYFFMSPMQANATLQQLKGSNTEMDLKISAFSLGKIWFSLLNSGSDSEVTLKAPGATEGTKAKGVQYRLVPDQRDLLGARMLLTMTPEDGEKMKGEGMTPEIAAEAMKKAMTDSPKFNASFNEIPVFTIAQMRMQKKPEEGDNGEPVTLLPMYFNLQNMVGTWQQFMANAPDDIKGMEPAINLMALHELVGMMQKESEIDWRNVVLVPGTPVADGSSPAAAAMQAPAGNNMAQMGGATLGDI